MPRSLKTIVNSIYAQRFAADWSVEFESNVDRLDPLLDQLGSVVPDALRDYLNHCIPTGGVGAGGLVDFHELEDLILEHTEAVPGCDFLPHGFFSIAKEGDGSQFAFCIHDSRVYHLGSGAGRDGTIASIQESARSAWSTLAEFLLYIESEEAKD